MRQHSLHGNRETPRSSTGDSVDRLDKALRRKSSMHVRGESDNGTVPQKPPNNSGPPTDAEAVEGRPSTTGNVEQAATPRTQSHTGVSTALLRVREAARRDRCATFTALLHHVAIDRLRDNFLALQCAAASGVDRMTWQQYEQSLEDRLVDLHRRIHEGTCSTRFTRWTSSASPMDSDQGAASMMRWTPRTKRSWDAG